MDRLPAEEHSPAVAGALARFTALAAAVLLALFAWLYAGAPPFDVGPASGGAWRGAMIVMVLASGAIGGCLYNFRGLTKHVQDRDFFPRYALSYRLRPFSGALCGLFVFALVYGGVLTLTLDRSEAVMDHRSAILYVAIALLAGYGSHEFLRKVKDINRTLFALSDAERQDRPAGPRPRRPGGDRDRPGDL